MNKCLPEMRLYSFKTLKSSIRKRVGVIYTKTKHLFWRGRSRVLHTLYTYIFTGNGFFHECVETNSGGFGGEEGQGVYVDSNRLTTKVYCTGGVELKNGTK